MPLARISDPRDLVVDELGSLLYLERQLAEKVLPKLEEEVADEELRDAVERHLEHTRGHIANIEHAFELLGESPTVKRTLALKGLSRDHAQQTKKLETERLQDLAHAEAAAKTEHVEIAAYESLITLAESLGELDVVRLLEENLRQEEEALRELRLAAVRLSTQPLSV